MRKAASGRHPMAAPRFHGKSGMISSYNTKCPQGNAEAVALAGNHELEDQNNRICIRKNNGFSNIRYVGSPRFEVGLTGFAAIAPALSGVGTTIAISNTLGMANGCMDAPGKVNINGANTYCGDVLAPTGGMTAAAPIVTGPQFQVTHVSGDNGAAATRGFCITYSQV